MSDKPHGRVTQIPVPGGSGRIRTGAVQFANDWPGLFIRGDEAIGLTLGFEEVQKRLADHPDALVRRMMSRLKHYVDIINRDVVVREGD